MEIRTNDIWKSSGIEHRVKYVCCVLFLYFVCLFLYLCLYSWCVYNFVIDVKLKTAATTLFITKIKTWNALYIFIYYYKLCVTINKLLFFSLAQLFFSYRKVIILNARGNKRKVSIFVRLLSKKRQMWNAIIIVNKGLFVCWFWKKIVSICYIPWFFNSTLW